MDLLLKDLRWHNGLDMTEGDIRITRGLIVEAGRSLPQKKNECVEDFQSQFLYPGLINAHDHLEMNLYPRLGKPPYRNYVEWAKDIYKPDKPPVKQVERLNIQYRLLWGGIKNLIAGVTTVAHHNPWHRSLGSSNFPVNVLKIAWAHSLAFEKNIVKKWPRKKDVPFVVHAAEGVDALAHQEIAHLKQLTLLNNNTVLVHAVGLGDESLRMIEETGASVVWCPASNLFMFQRTAPIDKLRTNISVALGSDSCLTGSPTLLHELHTARKTNLATPEKIFEMVTEAPAKIFHLPPPAIVVGRAASLFVARVKTENYYENLLTLSPADVSLVLTRGVPQLKNSDTVNRWRILKNPVKVDGVGKWCMVDVASLKKKIQKIVPLQILERNPLWHLVET